MHRVLDWFAYATWQEGRLVRSLSVSPDDGVIEDIGTPLPFEQPYWGSIPPPIPTTWTRTTSSSPETPRGVTPCPGSQG
jgi:hypothetical protein